MKTNSKRKAMDCLFLALVLLFSFMACQDDATEHPKSETESAEIERYMETLSDLSVFVASLSTGEQEELYKVCQSYLNADEDGRLSLQEYLISQLNLNKNNLPTSVMFGQKVIREKLNRRYNCMSQDDTVITRGNSCAEKRDAALKDLALKYEVELAAACLAAPLTGGVGTAIAVAALTVVTEIDRQAIHKEYEECMKS